MNAREQKADVGFYIAMQSEAKPIAEALNLTQIEHLGSITIYRHPTLPVVIYTPGTTPEGADKVGKVPAAITVPELIKRENPRLLINCGTLGGIEGEKVKIGDIIVSDTGTQHDQEIGFQPYTDFSTRTVFGSNRQEKPNSDERITDHVVSLLQQNHPNFQIVEGVVSTGESLILHDYEEEPLKTSHAVGKDMEAIALLEAVQSMREIYGYAGTVLMIKAVSDIVELNKKEMTLVEKEKKQQEFLKNLPIVMQKLTEVIQTLFDHKEQLFAQN